MCLMLYLATPRPLAGAPPSPLQLHLVSAETSEQLRGVVTLPHVCRVTNGSCSCSFPSSMEPGPIEYRDDLLDGDTERALAAAHVRALLQVIERSIAPDEHVELFPVWNGDEAAGSRGRIETSTAAIDPERFCFAEAHLYVLRS
jgi:hypothetical protein